MTKPSPVEAISGSLSSSAAFRLAALSTTGRSEAVVLSKYGRTGVKTFSADDEAENNERINTNQPAQIH